MGWVGIIQEATEQYQAWLGERTLCFLLADSKVLLGYKKQVLVRATWLVLDRPRFVKCKTRCLLHHKIQHAGVYSIVTFLMLITLFLGISGVMSIPRRLGPERLKSSARSNLNDFVLMICHESRWGMMPITGFMIFSLARLFGFNLRLTLI